MLSKVHKSIPALEFLIVGIVCIMYVSKLSVCVVYFLTNCAYPVELSIV